MYRCRLHHASGAEPCALRAAPLPEAERSQRHLYAGCVFVQVGWHPGCTVAWLQSPYCDQECGRCSGSPGGSTCSDNPPTNTYTCAQQVSLRHFITCAIEGKGFNQLGFRSIRQISPGAHADSTYNCAYLLSLSPTSTQWWHVVLRDFQSRVSLCHYSYFVRVSQLTTCQATERPALGK